MSDKDTGEIDEVLEGEHEKLDNSPDEKLSDEEYDQWVKENYSELEEIVQERKQEKNENSEPDKIEINGKEKDYLELMRSRDELTEIIGDRKLSDHKDHTVWVAILSQSLVTLAFIYDPWFASISFAGAIYGFAQQIGVISKKSGGKFTEFISNHFKFYIIAGMLQVLLFVGSGEPLPDVEGALRLFTSLIVGA